jgi:uncharacterized membrane protein
VEADSSEPARQVAQVYRWTGLLLSVCWIFEYVPARDQLLVLTAVGAVLFVAAGYWRNQEVLLASLGFSLLGIISFWLGQVEEPVVGYLPQLLGFGILFGQQRAARRWQDRFPPEVHPAFILAAGIGLWRWASLVMQERAEGFFLTAAWALLAFLFLLAGLLLRERPHRWLAFGILAAALGRAMVLDVWKLDTLYRIVSFVALGIVLLVLGFIYNRYQEKIRTWL